MERVKGGGGKAKREEKHRKGKKRSWVARTAGCVTELRTESTDRGGAAPAGQAAAGSSSQWLNRKRGPGHARHN